MCVRGDEASGEYVHMHVKCTHSPLPPPLPYLSLHTRHTREREQASTCFCLRTQGRVSKQCLSHERSTKRRKWSRETHRVPEGPLVGVGRGGDPEVVGLLVAGLYLYGGIKGKVSSEGRSYQLGRLEQPTTALGQAKVRRQTSGRIRQETDTRIDVPPSRCAQGVG